MQRDGNRAWQRDVTLVEQRRKRTVQVRNRRVRWAVRGVAPCRATKAWKDEAGDTRSVVQVDRENRANEGDAVSRADERTAGHAGRGARERSDGANETSVNASLTVDAVRVAASRWVTSRVVDVRGVRRADRGVAEVTGLRVAVVTTGVVRVLGAVLNLSARKGVARVLKNGARDCVEHVELRAKVTRDELERAVDVGHSVRQVDAERADENDVVLRGAVFEDVEGLRTHANDLVVFIDRQGDGARAGREVHDGLPHGRNTGVYDFERTGDVHRVVVVVVRARGVSIGNGVGAGKAARAGDAVIHTVDREPKLTRGAAGVDDVQVELGVARCAAICTAGTCDREPHTGEHDQSSKSYLCHP